VTRLFALLGSGEFEPWTEQADRWLLERATGGGGVLILPAASAPEGDQVFDMWADMGLTHYQRLGIPAEVVLLKTRSDADDPAFVSKLESASVAYFSGGNPAYLAQTLSGSAFWEELLRQVGRGMAYAGCSAGVACLGELAPDSSVQDFTQDLWRPGLRLFPGFSFGPHWDALDTYVPGLRDIIVAAIPQGQQLLGIDEHTAMVGDGNDWTVHGSGGAHLRLDEGAWKEFGAGTSFSLSLLPS
jgi:cyanophycinase